MDDVCKPYLFGDINAALIFIVIASLSLLSKRKSEINSFLREELNGKDSKIAFPPTSVIVFLSPLLYETFVRETRALFISDLLVG